MGDFMLKNSNFSMYIVTGFYKVDEDYKILSNQSFEYKTIESDEKISVLEINEIYDGLYMTDQWTGNTYSEMSNIIPEILNNELVNLKTRDDVLELQSKLQVSIHNYYKGDELKIPLPIKIKQTKTLEGYKTNDLVLISRYDLSFSYDDSNNITSIDNHIEVHNTNSIIRFENYDAIKDLSDFSKYDYEIVDENDRNIINNNTCINQSTDGMIITDTLNGNVCENVHQSGSMRFSLVHYFMDQKGTVKLSIDNMVNNVYEFNAKDNRELNYKVIVRNNGDATSGNNIVMTNVPNEISVKEESISDEGIYDDKDNTITWRLDTLDAGEKYTFTYNAIVPVGADKNKSYVGKSKVFSNQSDVVYSKETKVFLNKSSEVINGKDNLVNPNTYNTAVFGFSFILVILVIGVYIVKKKESHW